MGIGTYILVSVVKILLAVFILLTAVAYTVLLAGVSVVERWRQRLSGRIDADLQRFRTPPTARAVFYEIHLVVVGDDLDGGGYRDRGLLRRRRPRRQRPAEQSGGGGG